jgi:hypothetical protein
MITPSSVTSVNNYTNETKHITCFWHRFTENISKQKLEEVTSRNFQHHHGAFISASDGQHTIVTRSVVEELTLS